NFVMALKNFRDSYAGQRSFINLSDHNYYYRVISEWLDLKKNSFCYAVAYFFRACQSLQDHTGLSDEKIREIWLTGSKKEIFTDDSDGHNFYSAIKKALVEKNLPFSVVSAWIQMLIFIHAPTLLTAHGNRPTFDVAIPVKEDASEFVFRFPFQPVE